jgi:hypothetical protein
MDVCAVAHLHDRKLADNCGEEKTSIAKVILLRDAGSTLRR